MNQTLLKCAETEKLYLVNNPDIEWCKAKQGGWQALKSVIDRNRWFCGDSAMQQALAGYGASPADTADAAYRDCSHFENGCFTE